MVTVTSRFGTDMPIAYLNVLARAFLALLGLGGVVWGVASFPFFWQEQAVERTAAEIVDRATFKPGALVALVPSLERIETAGYCRPEALRSAAVIRLRLAEEALATADRDTRLARLEVADRSVRSALSCAPSDAYLWMVLAWIDGVRPNGGEEQMAYLRLSYELGPNEGWIAVVRSRLALTMFRRLPADLADAAVSEFSRMVNSWLYWDSIAVVTGPGWPIHARLLAALENVGIRQREALAKELYSEGRDVVIPGVTLQERRPWY